MIVKSPIHVIHLIRGIGSTSMPWNDLYRTLRRLAPGMMYPPLLISPWQVRVVTCWENCLDKKRKYFKAGPISALTLIRWIYQRVINRGGCLVLHVHNPVLGFIVVIAKIVCPQIKVIVNLHNDWSFFRCYQKVGLLLLAKIGDRFITVSKSIFSSIPKYELLRLKKTKKLIAIPNGIESTKIAEYKRVNSSTATAVVIARMVPQKNCMFILKLLYHIRAIKSLIWFGEGYEKNNIKNEIKKLGIENRIELRGQRPRAEVYQTLARSSIYISASRWEGIGVANLEAAALGCWPFMSAIPAHKEIAETLNISTYPLDDIGIWTKAIEGFLSLPNNIQKRKRRELSELALRHFDLNVLVSKYIEVYSNLNCK